MKRAIRSLTLFALALLFATGPAFAQTPMQVGVNTGIGFANLGGDAEQLLETSLESKLGSSIGAFFGVDLHRMFRLQLEGQYVQKGTKTTEEGVDVKIKLDYIEFMVPLTLLIPTEGRFTPRLYAGPAVGIELSCKFSGSQDGFTVDFDCDSEEVGAETKSIDFGVFFGGGVDFAAGPGAIRLDVLYNLGLTDINDVADVDESIKNQNIQILVGYAFVLGG